MILEIIVAVIFLAHFLSKYTKFYRTLDILPGPLVIPLIGSSYVLLGEPDSSFKKLRALNKKYFPIYKIWLGLDGGVCIQTPEDIQQILNNSIQIEKSVVYNPLLPWLNRGLLTSTGAYWHSRRKILTASFHFNILKQFYEVFVSCSDQLVEDLSKECNNSKTDIVPYITKSTLNIICETAMGTRLDPNNEEQNEYVKAVHGMAKIVFGRLTKPWMIYDFTFNLTPTARLQKKLLNTLHNFTKSVIEERKLTFTSDQLQMNDSENNEEDKPGKRRLAMLDLLLSAKANGENIDDKGICEEVDTFMFEGHDTTSVSLCYTLLLIAHHKDVQDKIIQEINEVLPGNKWPPSFQDMQQFSYLDRCIKESQRLYPSVPLISRKIQEPFTAQAGYVIPAGADVHIHIYDLHRNPDIYPDPEKFDPDRFLPEASRARHAFAYIPFSAGPRNCIGQRFAMLELKTIIVAVLRKYIMTAMDEPKDVVFINDLVLRMKHGINIKFSPRKQDNPAFKQTQFNGVSEQTKNVVTGA